MGDNESDLVWIARQALQTSVPTPWIECETADGDVFYYNTRTRESIWDHPFDAYYKEVIRRYKANLCTKEELVVYVSQSWLLSGVDNRPSHLSMEMPVSPKQIADDLSPRARRISSGSMIPRVSMSPPDDTHGSHRRRSADDSPKNEDHRPESTSLRMTPDLDLTAAHARINDLSIQNSELRKRYRFETDNLTKDLIKSRDFIELLIQENKTLKKRMTDASSKVSGMRAETIILKERLVDEIRRRESAEERVEDLEEHIRQVEAMAATSSSRRNSRFFSKLCGSEKNTTGSPINGISSGTRPVIGERPRSVGGPATPRRQLSANSVHTPPPTSPDLYRDILNLLAPPTSPPQHKPAPLAAQISPTPAT